MPLSQLSQFLAQSTLTPDRTQALVMYNLRVFFCHNQQSLDLTNLPTGTSGKLKPIEIPGYDGWGVGNKAILGELGNFSTVRQEQ